MNNSELPYNSIIEKLKKRIFMILKEAVATVHAKRQFEERFMSNHTMNVGIEVGLGNYEDVGTYNIDDNIISELSKRFELLTKKSFPKNKSYGVKILDIPINPIDVNYYNPEKAQLYQNKQMYKAPFVLLNDNVHDSNGNCVYAIIRGGEITTTMLAKNYIKMTPDKLNVDFVIKDWNLIINNQVR